MHLMNTTFVVDHAIDTRFRQWLDNVYIRAALITPFLSEPVLMRVLGHDQPGATTYALHMKSTSLEEARRWHDETAAILHDDMAARFGQRAVFFTTYLEILG